MFAANLISLMGILAMIPHLPEPLNGGFPLCTVSRSPPSARAWACIWPWGPTSGWCSNQAIETIR